MDENMISGWLQARLLSDRPLCWNEYQQMRLNSYERAYILDKITDDCLVGMVTYVLDNVRYNKLNTSRPCVTYDEALSVVLVPELLRRFRDRRSND